MLPFQLTLALSKTIVSGTSLVILLSHWQAIEMNVQFIRITYTEEPMALL